MAVRASGDEFLGFRRRFNSDSFATLNFSDLDNEGSDVEEIVEEESEDEKDVNDENSDPNAKVVRSKKKGRKGSWSEKQVGDMIDVICDSENFQKKLIFTNVGKNTEIYQKVQSELWQRYEAEGLDAILCFPFSPEQMRTKFKRCVGDCKKAALLRKTASGIAALQEEKQYGPWFNRLFPLVKSRDSCQPERAKEPSASLPLRPSELDQSNEVSVEGSSSAERSESNQGDEMGVNKKLFTPRKRKRSKRVDDHLEKALHMMQRVVESDETDKMIRFMEEENRKAREHEVMLFQMMMSVISPQPLYQPHFNPAPVTNILNTTMPSATLNNSSLGHASSNTVPTVTAMSMGQGILPTAPGQLSSLLSDPTNTFTQ